MFKLINLVLAGVVTAGLAVLWLAVLPLDVALAASGITGALTGMVAIAVGDELDNP